MEQKHPARDYYSLLNIPETATKQEIQVAFRRLALQHHPDKGGNAAVFLQVI